MLKGRRGSWREQAIRGTQRRRFLEPSRRFPSTLATVEESKWRKWGTERCGFRVYSEWGSRIRVLVTLPLRIAEQVMETGGFQRSRLATPSFFLSRFALSTWWTRGTLTKGPRMHVCSIAPLLTLRSGLGFLYFENVLSKK